jgi:hypothetical protein
MTRSFYHIAAALAALIARPAAAADWDRVSWGMTSTAIAAIYGERAKVLSSPIVFGDSYVDVVLLDVGFADYKFRAYFQMDNATHRLAHVMLERRRQHANPKIWNAVVKGLRETLGKPSRACNEAGERGRPTRVEGVWQRPDETVEATYLDFATPVERYNPSDLLGPDLLIEVQPFYRNLYPARRILIRYSQKGVGRLGCEAR